MIEPYVSQPSRHPRVPGLAKLAPLFFLVIAASCAHDPAELRDRYLSSGQEYIDQGDLSAAAIEFRNAIKADPRSTGSHYKLGVTYLLLGRHEDAARAFAQVTALDSNHAEAQLRRGNLLLFQRKFADARSRAEHVLQEDPTNFQARVLLGSSYAGLLHLNSTIDELLDSFRTEPRLLPAYLALAEDGNPQLDAERAEQIFLQLVKENPDSPLAQLVLANFYLAQRVSEKAEALLHSALKLAPESVEVHEALAAFYFQTSRMKESEEVYKTLVQLSPKVIFRRIILAKFYSQTGRYRESIRLHREILADDSENALVRGNLAALYLAEQELEEASSTIAEMLDRDAESVQGLLLRGQLFIAEDRPREAVDALEELKKTAPRLARVRYTLGLAYLQSEILDRGEAELSKTLEIDPYFVPAYIRLSQLKLNMGFPEAAIRNAQEALRLNPNETDARIALGHAYAAGE